MGSQGFVKFKIGVKPPIEEGKVVNNKAYIYFDYNEAIITENEKSSWVDEVIIGTTEISACDCSLRYGEGVVELQFPSPKPRQIELLDSRGRLVSTFQSNKQKVAIDHTLFSKGMHLIRIREDGKTSGIKALLR